MTVEHDVLGDLMRDSLDHCVKCTICETYCPVAAVTPLFPGPANPDAAFLTAAERGEPAWPDVALAVDAHRLVDAVYRSLGYRSDASGGPFWESTSRSLVCNSSFSTRLIAMPSC